MSFLSTISTLTAVLASLLATAMPSDAAILGGYSPTQLTPELRNLLVTSLANPSLYRACVARRICVNDVLSVRQQVVAGMNYAFAVTGCDVATTLKAQLPVATKAAIAKELGACSAEMAKSCVPIKSIVTVFEQSWSSTVEVSSIIVQQ